MYRLTTLALLCVLLPAAGLAQSPPPSPPPDAPVAAPPLVSAPEEVEPEEPFAPGPEGVAAAREEPGPPTGVRILVGTLAGGAGTLTGGLVGGMVGIATSDNCGIIEGDCTFAGVFALSGMALGAATGTYIAGRLMKGGGSFFGTLLGSTLGTGAGLLMVVAGADSGDGTLGLIGLLALPAVGAVTGYELSRVLESPTRFSLTVTHESSEVPVVPVIGTTPHGGFMGGLTGRF